MGKQPRRNTSNKTDDLLNNQSKNLDEIQQRRLNHLQAHLNPSATPPQKSPASSKPVVTSATSQQEKVSDDVKKDTIGEMLVMNERYRAHQQPVFEVMRECPSLFTHNTNDLSRADMFDLTFRRMKYLCTEKKLFRAQDCTSNYVVHSARLQAVMTFDESLYLKIALQFNFFAGSLHHLGTPERSFYGSEQFLNQINSLEIMGCFAITEVSHGTNVSSIETSAVYDAHSKEFIINSPRKQSMKWWIGNSGHAHMCIVFAQLYIENQCYGVHCFIVPLRTCKYTHPEREPNEILPGITIGDCGPKIGYNGLDNGYIIFDNVRIPDNYMLDKFATITSESGRAIYRSTIESPSKRFGAMLAQLTMGRSGLVGSATHTYALALRTAVPYSFERTQFTLPMSPTKSIEDQLRVNDSEFPLITFQEQKLKLYPLLSEMFAFQFASKHIFNLYIDTMSVMPSDPSKKNKKKNTDKSKAAAMQKLHVESSGLKAYCTEQTMNALNTLRASCGGHGYSDSNRFGAWRNAIDVTRTFEGDNTVLLQQVSKHLLSEYQKAYNNHSNFISTGVHYLYDQVNGHLKDTQLAQYTGSVADPWFFTSALESRTKRLTHTAALRYQDAVRKLTEQSSEEYATNIKKLSEHDLKEYQDNHKARNTFLAWNHVQNHLVNASKASVERDTVNYFIEACEQFKKENPEDTENLALLQRLCTLYALTIIQNDLGWFLRHCIADSQAQSIRREITKLCEEFTKEEVYSLLSSLHIPDDILDVPIAMRLDVDSPHATRSDEWTRDYMKNSYQRSLRFQKFGNVEKHNDGDW